MIDGNRIQDLLDHPEDFIESGKYVSWERFFTALLINETKDTYLTYNKSRLNPAYVNEREKSRIVQEMRELTGTDIFQNL